MKKLMLLAGVLLLVLIGIGGCAANSHFQKIGPDTWKFDWEFYRTAKPQILVDVYRGQENITEEQWTLLHESTEFTVVSGHPKDFDGHVTQVKVYLDNVGPVFARKEDTGYRFQVTTGQAASWYGSFRDLTPGYHTIVVQVEWEAWKPYWYKGRPTRDFTAWTWVEILVDQSYLARFEDDPGIYDAAKKKEPRLLVKEQGQWLDVTAKKRIMFDNSEVYAVTVGKSEGYVQDILVYLDNIRIPVDKRGIYYTFGVTIGRTWQRHVFQNVSAGKHLLRVEIIRTKNPEPVPQPPGEGQGGKQTSQTALSVLEVDPTFLSW